MNGMAVVSHLSRVLRLPLHSLSFSEMNTRPTRSRPCAVYAAANQVWGEGSWKQRPIKSGPRVA